MGDIMHSGTVGAGNMEVSRAYVALLRNGKVRREAIPKLRRGVQNVKPASEREACRMQRDRISKHTLRLTDAQFMRSADDYGTYIVSHGSRHAELALNARDERGNAETP